jgi:hypothetical protein
MSENALGQISWAVRKAQPERSWRGFLTVWRSPRRVTLRLSHLGCLCTASVQWIIPPSACGLSGCISRIGDQCGVDQRTVCTPIIGIHSGMIRVGIIERFLLIVRRKIPSAHQQAMASWLGRRRRCTFCYAFFSACVVSFVIFSLISHPSYGVPMASRKRHTRIRLEESGVLARLRCADGQQRRGT